LFILDYHSATKYVVAVREVFCCVSYEEGVYETRVFRSVAVVTHDTLCLVGETLTLLFRKYEGKSISKLQIVIEKRRMGIMTYKQHSFFNVISKQI